jgi:crotonobetainyl-CoA:carnitine CoA-transferase CaiB-like acyl-CoA transferase
MTTATMPPVKALQGIRVIETASFLAGPFAAVQMAEFGAEVIKVELPGTGDPLRKFGTVTECGDSLPWLSECRNKKSVTLDIRTKDGAALFKKLIADADVLIENFQTGTMEKWGLGWDVLSKLNPRLIMVRITGYGQTGPYKDRPGFGRIGNAFGGLSYLAGYPDRPPVTPGSATIPDYLAGIYGAMGALLALRARDITGVGQVIDIGLYEPVFRILDELAASYHYKGYVRERMGPGTVNVVPHSHYPTKDKKWIAIACTSDKIFERLAEAMGKPALAGEDGKWGTLARREAERALVDTFVGDWTGTFDRAGLMALCEKFQVPCGPVYSIAEIFDDPHYKARENLAFIQDPRAGEIAVPAPQPRLNGTPATIEWLGPALGAHNTEIFQGLLGLSAKEIEVLKDKKVM